MFISQSMIKVMNFSRQRLTLSEDLPCKKEKKNSTRKNNPYTCHTCFLLAFFSTRSKFWEHCKKNQFQRQFFPPLKLISSVVIYWYLLDRTNLSRYKRDPNIHLDEQGRGKSNTRPLKSRFKFCGNDPTTSWAAQSIFSLAYVRNNAYHQSNFKRSLSHASWNSRKYGNNMNYTPT